MEVRWEAKKKGDYFDWKWEKEGKNIEKIERFISQFSLAPIRFETVSFKKKIKICLQGKGVIMGANSEAVIIGNVKKAKGPWGKA